MAPYPRANPCLLIAQATLRDARQQIDWARDHSRTFCLRLNLADGIGRGIPQWIPELVAVLEQEGANDYAVVLDFGWVKDALSIAERATAYARGIFANISKTVPIAVCCTTFPKNFKDIGPLDVQKFSNRDLLASIKKATNHPTIIYGDWGTTGPRSNIRASRPKNRIDYPTVNSWVIARDQDDDVTFQEAAKRITNCRHWDGRLGIWGEQLIKGAADGQAFAIDTIPKMCAARINIHLHVQAFHDHLPQPEDLDEEWSDEL